MRKAITDKISTAPYHGYNVKFSPFVRNLVACAAAEDFGISNGNGFLYLFNTSNAPGTSVKGKWFHGLYDVTWSEKDPDIVVTGCCDGTIQIWDTKNLLRPPLVYKIHEKEVYSVDWNAKNRFPFILSASWDTTVKLWDTEAGRQIDCFKGHRDKVYGAIWSVHSGYIFSSVAGDGTMQIWDSRMNDASVIPISHPSEVLTCDWCKLNPNVIASGTTNGVIRGWDIRNVSSPIFQLVGHEYAVRKLKFSPFQESALASVSYDFTTRFWDWSCPEALQICNAHTEFVYGLDFDPLNPGQVCDCAWDSIIHIYNDV